MGVVLKKWPSYESYSSMERVPPATATSTLNSMFELLKWLPGDLAKGSQKNSETILLVFSGPVDK